MGNSERNKDSVINFVSGTEVINSFGYILAQRNNLVPGTRSFKGLSNEVEVLSEISHISNDKGKEISSESIGGSSFQSLIFGCNFSHKFLLRSTSFFASFEEGSGSDHVLGIVSTDFCYVELLYSVD